MRTMLRPRLLDLDGWLLAQVGRARLAVAELRHAHPSEDRGRLAQRLIDEKKQLATSAGAITGFFGWAAIPVDLAWITWLRFTLALELAVLHGINLKGRSGRAELLDLLGLRESDLASLARAVPLVAARLGSAWVRRLGWRAVGRAVPILAAPLAAWVNGRDIQRLGDEAIRRFDTFRRVRTAPRS